MDTHNKIIGLIDGRFIDLPKVTNVLKEIDSIIAYCAIEVYDLLDSNKGNEECITNVLKLLQEAKNMAHDSLRIEYAEYDYRDLKKEHHNRYKIFVKKEEEERERFNQFVRKFPN